MSPRHDAAAAVRAELAGVFARRPLGEDAPASFLSLIHI